MNGNTNHNESSQPRIMLVDDDANLLSSLRRQVHGKFNASCVDSPAQALEILDKYGPFAVVVSDLKMPGMSGIDLIAEIRKRNPNTVAILLTGDGDVQTAARAVNESQVFRYLNKPCDSQLLLESIRSGVEHYRLTTAEADLLGKTLSGSVRMLTQVLSMAMPEAFGMSQEAKSLTGAICRDLQIEATWQAELAAMLMRIGMVAVPPEIASRYFQGEPLEPADWSAIKQSAHKGCDLIAAIPRLEPVGKWVGQQFEAPSADISPIVKVLQIVGEFQRRSIKSTVFDTLQQLEEHKSNYDRSILDSLRKIVCQQFESGESMVSDLSVGMILEDSICDSSGRMLVSKGTEMHSTLVERIQTMHANGTEIVEPIRVRFFKSAVEPESVSNDAA